MADDNDDGMLGSVFGNYGKILGATWAVYSAKNQKEKEEAAANFVRAFHELDGGTKLFIMALASFLIPDSGFDFKKALFGSKEDRLAMESNFLTKGMAKFGNVPECDAGALVSNVLKNADEKSTEIATVEAPAPAPAATVPAAAPALAQTAAATQQTSITAPGNITIAVPAAGTSTTVTVTSTSVAPIVGTINRPAPLTQSAATLTESQTPPTASNVISASPQTLTAEALVKAAEDRLESADHKGLSAESKSEIETLLRGKVGGLYLVAHNEANAQNDTIRKGLLLSQGRVTDTLVKKFQDSTHEELHETLSDPAQVATLQKLAAEHNGQLPEDKATLEKAIVDGIPAQDLKAQIAANMPIKWGIKLSSGI